MRIFSRKKNKELLLAAALSTVVLAAGCGGGSGFGVGDRGGDGIPPVVKMTVPAQNSRVSDVDFRAESFNIQISYTDTSQKDINSLSVTMKMDDGSAQNITNYFSDAGNDTIKSTNLYQFNRTLFELATNQASRVMTLNFSVKDRAGNTGSASGSFIVYPQGVAPPPQ